MSSTIMSSGHYRRSRRLSKITRRLRHKSPVVTYAEGDTS